METIITNKTISKKQIGYGKDFSLVVIGQIISLFGNAILRFALPLYLLRTTGSSTLFGMVTACSFLPMIVLYLVGGVLADRVNKRNIMVILDFVTAGIVSACYLLMENVPIVALIVVMLMLLYGISGTYQPAVQASVPILVPKERILSASAVINQVSALASFIGPILGGVLYGLWGISFILKIGIFCFACSAVMELFIHIPHQKRPNKDKMLFIVKSDLSESLRFIKDEKPIFIKVCVVVAGLNLVLSSMITIGIPILIVDTLKLTDQMLGVTQGALAIGGIIGGLLTVVLQKKLKVQKAYILLVSCSIFAAIMGLCMLPQGQIMMKYILITVTSLLVTVFSSMFSIQMLALVQTETPENLIGKVIACVMVFIMCAQPLGQLLYGVLFEQLAHCTGALMIGAAVISFIIALYSRNIFTGMEEKADE
ncbi:MAG: MFS transporter [Lachnospiraceae bacterium]